MGTSVSDTDEWIELYNDGTEEVSLSGWTITSSGTAPNITLTGSIAAGGYYLLERTDDATVPDIQADKVYTGALSNDGSTLTLTDSSGAAIDTVVGGTDWKNIGGNNSTKATPQRNGSLWSTGTPTPRAVNIIGGNEDEADDEEEDETGTTTPVVTVGGTAPSTSSHVQSPRRTISIDAGNDRIVLAQVPTPYTAVIYSKNERAIEDAKVTWSFGDGTRAEGKAVEHAYRAPGEYALIVRATHKEAEVLRTLKVVVENAAIDVATETAGIRVTNIGQRLVDLSQWQLAAGEGAFVFPDDTALWPGSSVVFATEVTGLATGTPISLLFPKGETVAVAEPAIVEEMNATPIAAQKPIVRTGGIQEMRMVDLLAPVATQSYEEVIEAPTAAAQQAAVGAALVSSNTPTWLLCLFGNLLACSAALVVR